MTLPFLMVFAGFVLVVAGWKQLPFLDALRGNFQ